MLLLTKYLKKNIYYQNRIFNSKYDTVRFEKKKSNK